MVKVEDERGNSKGKIILGDSSKLGDNISSFKKDIVPSLNKLTFDKPSF